MKTICAAILFALCLPHLLMGQQTNTSASKVANPFDLSDGRDLIGSSSEFPTILELKEIEDKARAAFKTDCKVAIPLLEQYARQANAMANLVRVGLRPFYNASLDDRKKPSVQSRLDQRSHYEGLSNGYIDARNEAMVMQAECYVKTGDSTQAGLLLYRVLELISAGEVYLWDRARTDLYEIIGVPK